MDYLHFFPFLSCLFKRIKNTTKQKIKISSPLLSSLFLVKRNKTADGAHSMQKQKPTIRVSHMSITQNIIMSQLIKYIEYTVFQQRALFSKNVASLKYLLEYIKNECVMLVFFVYLYVI